MNQGQTVRRCAALLCLLATVFFSGSSRSTAAEKFTVVLDWFVNPDHAPLVAAKEKGYFAASGLDVELIAPADPNDPPKLVAAGKADLAVSYQPQFHVHVSEGLPLARVGTLIGTPLNCLVVLAKGPVRSIADLKGRRIGFSVGGFEEAVLGKMLANHGLKLSDVTLVNVNFSLSPSLLSGQVDAVIGAFRNFELAQLDIAGNPGRAFFPEKEGVPPYEELILVANRDRLRDPKVVRFLKALEKGVRLLREHPAEGWALFVKSHKDLDDELNRRAWKNTVPLFAPSPAALNEKRYEDFARFMLEQKLIKRILPLKSYAMDLTK